MKDFFYEELNKDLGIVGNLDVNDEENPSEFVYGKLNKLVEQKEYKGVKTPTAEVKVDNINNTISADVDTSTLATREYVDQKAYELDIEKADKSELKTNLSQFVNDGDGKSPFATQDYVSKSGGKIDSLSINNQKLDIDEEKNVAIPLASYETYGVVKTSAIKGTIIENGILSVNKASEQDILNQKNEYKPIVSSNYKAAVENIVGKQSDIANGEPNLVSALNKEADVRQSQANIIENLLNKEIEDRVISTDSLQTSLNQETESRKEADKKLQDNIDLKLDKSAADKMFVTDVNTEVASGETINVVIDQYNPNTLSTLQKTETLSGATETNAGLMTAADVKTLTDVKKRVESLEGKTTRLLYRDKTNPTASDINTFVTSLGYTSPFEGVAVVVQQPDGSQHIWHYYENDSIGWKDDGLDTVTIFTNNIAGIIKGSEIDGKVYAETDGTGSVHGWDTLKNSVADNTQNITNLGTELSQEKTTRENADKTLQTNIDNEVSRAQTAETDLLNKINAETTSRTNADTQLQTNINTVEENAKKINVQADTPEQGMITFTNYKGESTSFRSGYLPDDSTIYLNSDKKLSAIGVIDTTNNITKTAENLIKGTTIVVLGEDDE